MTQVDRGAGDAPSDAELILQVRSGDREAFGVLYSRHSGAAGALARQYVNSSDADDVVADAFSKLYEMLRRGAGPDSGFRTYLYTVVRHRSYDVSRGATRMRPAEDAEIEAALGRVASSEDPALHGFERSVVSRAYFSLPERWREVLWYCLVDDLRPAQVAPVLGLSSNGVSALLYRAKDALRNGYLQQHLSHAPSDTCRAVNPNLGGYVRGSLSKRERARIQSHLDGCGTCSALVLELADVAHGMKCVVAPLLLGAAGLALVGTAIPVGAGLAAAVNAASAGGAAGASMGGGAVAGVGNASVGLSGIGASAGTTAGAGAAASTTAGATAATTAGATATTTAGAAATGSAVTAGATATSVAGATAGATAVGVVGASGAAATGGAASAGAITVAAVGVVAALQLIGPSAEPVSEVAPAVASAPAQAPTALPAEPTTGATSPPDENRPDDPANLPVALIGELGLSYLDDGALQPRQVQNLALTVKNSGSATTTGTMVRVTLPAGLAAATPAAPSGQGVVANQSWVRPTSTTPVTEPTGAPTAVLPGGLKEAGAQGDQQAASLPRGGSTPGSATTGNLRTICTPGATPDTVLCDVGALTAGQSRQVQLTVRAESGGSYPITAELWADGIDATLIELPERTVVAYGPELTAQATATGLASPGTGTLPLKMGNTGDRTAPSGWSMAITLPDGVRPAAVQQALACTGGEARTWSCAPRESAELAPGAWRELPLAVVAVPADTGAAVTKTTGTASVAPQGVARTLAARVEVGVTPAWSGAADGAGKLVAQCVTRGGMSSARSELVGTYTNTAARQVSVALEGGGKRTAGPGPLDPGQKATVRRDEGIRIPGGKASWVLTRTVEGVTYEHRVPAGSHQGVDCYDPAWDAEAKAGAVNADGAAGVRGTLVNRSDEPMDVTMVAHAGSGQYASSVKSVPPGESRSFTVSTGQRQLEAGAVSFQLRRWSVDRDGDAPTQAEQPTSPPQAEYGGAVVAPSYPDWPRTMTAPCTYDPERKASIGTFRVPVDNTASTLPVTFRLGDARLTVDAGRTGVVEAEVPWGTGELPLLIGKERSLARIDVEFESCAQVTWPTAGVTPTFEARCDADGALVVAGVRNKSATSWTGHLGLPARGTVGERAAIPAGQDARLQLRVPATSAQDRVIVLTLSRDFEGEERTVRQQYTVPVKACEPAPSCTTGSTAAAWIGSFFTGGCEKRDEPTARATPSGRV